MSDYYEDDEPELKDLPGFGDLDCECRYCGATFLSQEKTSDCGCCPLNDQQLIDYTAQRAKE